MVDDIYIQDINKTISIVNILDLNNGFFPVSAVMTGPSSDYQSGKMAIGDLVAYSTANAIKKIDTNYMLENIFDFSGNIKPTLVGGKIRLDYVPPVTRH